MSDIGLVMNGLLGVLLIGALFVGWRLEGRLKALRASHQSFTEAVHDLDRAAARAEQGLADLRAATDEAAESLAGRIERAAQLSGRLETLITASSAAEHRMAALPRPAAQPETAPGREQVLQRFAERYGPMGASPASQAASTHALAQAAARNDLILEDEPEVEPKIALLRRPVNERLERLKALAQPRALPARPAAARIEDELFEGPDLRRAGGVR
jgi:hypothetical protein